MIRRIRRRCEERSNHLTRYPIRLILIDVGEVKTMQETTEQTQNSYVQLEDVQTPTDEKINWMDRVDCLVRQLQVVTGSEDLCYKVLNWISTISTREIEIIVADYRAQEAEQPRPSFYMQETTDAPEGLP